MVIKKIGNVIKDHIKENKFTYLSLFLFYIVGIILGAASVNDLDYQQKDEMVTFFNGFLKLLETNDFSRITLFQMSLLDNLKIIVLFWLLGFTVVGFPMYYIVIGMRGFSTGFSSGIIMGVLGTKGIIISTLCFVPKEIIMVPCIIALGVNGIKLSRNILKSWLKRSSLKTGGVKQKIMPYSFVAGFFSTFILFATIIEAFISSGALKLLNL
ncbi:MAG: stage sporulation protein [Eubacterium sp.]|nr:stage sporulation protein [Eubacterium sp.]